MKGFRDFLTRRRVGSFLFDKPKNTPKKQRIIFTKDEPNYSRRLKRRGANGGRNVSRLYTKRRISGHMRQS